MRMLKDHCRYRARKRGSTHIFSRCGLSESLCGVGAVASSEDIGAPTKRHPLCKKCEAIADKRKLWGGELKVEPCPRCGNEGIELFNCGYSSFNPGGGRCPDCGFEVQEYVSWNDGDGAMAKVWNRGVKAELDSPVRRLEEKLKAERLKARRLRRQLRDHGLEPLE